MVLERHARAKENDMSMSVRTRLHFEDECPRIGNGVRIVDVKLGNKWAHLKALNGKKSKLPLATYFKIEERTFKSIGLLIMT